VRLVRLALAYFGLVFAVGFALGVVRVLWLVPRVGERSAELIEAPVMVLASYLAARALFGRAAVGLSREGAARAGLLALGLLVVVELTVVLSLRGLTWDEYVSQRDPVSGTVNLGSLVLFALMPVLVALRPRRRGSGRGEDRNSAIMGRRD
jgi:hypothetical protein